jgi:hypothetical protein
MLSGLAAVSLALGRAAGFWPLHPLIELAVLITCLSGAVCNMSGHAKVSRCLDLLQRSSDPTGGSDFTACAS